MNINKFIFIILIIYVMKTLILFFTFSIFCLGMMSCSEDEVVGQPYLTVEGLPQDSTFSFANKVGTRQITIKSNVDWQVVPKGETVEWCTVTSNIEDGKLLLRVLNNDDYKSRSCQYLVKYDGLTSVKILVYQLGVEAVLRVSYAPKTTPAKGGEFRFNVVSNVEYELSNNAKWLTRIESDTKASVSRDYIYNILENWDNKRREDSIYITPVDEIVNSLRKSIIIKQHASEYEDIFPEDKLIKVESAVLTRGTAYGGETAAMTFDGNHSTIFGSNKISLGDSAVIEYTLNSQTPLINSIHLIQREGTSISRFEAGSIWFQDENSFDWEFVRAFSDTKDNNVVEDVYLENPKRIKICLKNIIPENEHVSLAEVEFYELEDRGDFENDAQFFEDDMFSKLKSTTTEADIEKITSPILKYLTRELLANKYSNTFRARTYKGQRTPSVVSDELKFGSQSYCDNPTGIFFVAGEKCSAYLPKGAGSTVTLCITDFREEGGGAHSVTLREGMNVFTPRFSGNGFIQYYTRGTEALPDIKVHFVFGHEVGFWDVNYGHTNADWKQLLGRAKMCYNKLNHKDGYFTTCGKYSQLLNTLDAFEQWCPTDIERLMIQHDSVLILSYDLMGLSKNDVVPKNNRKLNLRTWGGSPNWSGRNANYPNEEKGMLDADNIHWWVFAHELGHGNQIKPHMSMVGWGECSNNIYSSYVNYVMGKGKVSDLEQYPLWRTNEEVTTEPALDGERFNSYLNEAHVAKKAYLTHSGYDYKAGELHEDKYLQTDHFVKLCPMWQLTLYFMLIGGEDHRPDFWADVNWAAIQDDRTDLSQGERYVNFMMRCMTSANLNLNQFFINMGLLKVVNHGIADYASDMVVITKADYDKVVAHGNTFSSAPKSSVMSYISFNSLNAFRNNLEVQGTFNSGVSDYTSKGCKRKEIEHSVWKHVVVFETYAGEELIDISMVGTGDASNTYTIVRYPDDATRIEAVSISGVKTLVYGTR